VELKAVRLTKLGAPLEEQEIETPAADANDVLIRVKAAGVCHSDAHYRAGLSPTAKLPLTLGHEVAGVIEETGERVCLHYLVTCGNCHYCRSGTEQFCPSGKMLGKHRDGGYAEFIALPRRSVFPLPPEVPFEIGAILMCSSATSLHALRKARLTSGETVAIYGVGGLGISAVQLAHALGAAQVFAIDINPRKLKLAARFGATPINASEGDPVTHLRDLTNGRGVDVALELVGLPVTMRQAVQSLATLGRAALVGLTPQSFEVAPYSELLNKEAEIIGVSDHLASELPQLLDFARTGKLDLSGGIIRTVPLEAAAVNAVLDDLENFSAEVRVVITP
jgi:D-arabinose 1-dehydrogenase-like Zn-dependent alcohol dehydrogenase